MLQTQYTKFRKLPRTDSKGKRRTARQRWVLSACAFLKPYITKRVSQSSYLQDSQESIMKCTPTGSQASGPKESDNTSSDSSSIACELPVVAHKKRKVRKSPRLNHPQSPSSEAERTAPSTSRGPSLPTVDFSLVCSDFADAAKTVA